MRWFRFSIASLLGVVVFTAFAIAALRAATEAWDSGVFGTTLIVPLSAVLLAVHRNAQRRAFWLGFALFGGAYLTASLIEPVASRLPSTRLLSALNRMVRPDTPFTIAFTSIPNATPVTVTASAFAPNGGTLALSNQQGVVTLFNAATGKLLKGPNGATEYFLGIGHSLSALVLGFVGGQLSRYLFLKGRGRLAQVSESDQG
jgi:hypothetical protein